MRRHGAGLLLCAVLVLGACAGTGGIRRKARVAKPTLASLIEENNPAEEKAAPAGLTRSVTVARGDSLWSIARREWGRGIRYADIAATNGLSAPWVIQPGQELTLAGGGGAPVRAVVAPKVAVKKAADEAKRYGWTRVPNRAFSVGEKLTFAVQYGSITAGYAVMSISEALLLEGRPVYHVVAEARTHPFFEKIFKVRDRIETYMDVDYLFPWRYEKHLREGGYQADAVYQYDQRAGRMREPDKGKDEAMPIGSQDVLSCFYFFRTMDMTPGSEQIIRVSADDMKSYELKVNVLKRERVKVLAGEFDTVLVQPHLKFQGVFQQKGEVFVWITDDERRIPVKVKSKIAIGSININLQDAEWVESAP